MIENEQMTPELMQLATSLSELVDTLRGLSHSPVAMALITAAAVTSLVMHSNHQSRRRRSR